MATKLALSTGMLLEIMGVLLDPQLLGRSSLLRRFLFSGVLVSHHFSRRLKKDSLLVEGQQLRYCGVGHGYDRVIIKGNVDEMKVRLATLCDAAYTDLNSALVHRVLRQQR